MAKPRKVEEPAGAYSASLKQVEKAPPSAPIPAQSGIRYLDNSAATKLADKIFSERKKLLHKLAQ